MITGMMRHAMIDAENPGGRPYAWKITRDRAFELDRTQYGADEITDQQGTTGPSHSTPVALAGLAAGEGIPFRIYCEGLDDNTGDFDGDVWVPTPGTVAEGHPDYDLVYEGLIYEEPHAAGDWYWAPVDDFTRANDGYSDIRYLAADGVTWESL